MAVVGPDPTAGGGVKTPDFQNPQAVRYARMQLQRMVQAGLIKSVGDATKHYGGDPTATWRALSVLTGPKHTYPGMTGNPSPHQLPGVAVQQQPPPTPLPPGAQYQSAANAGNAPGGNYGYDTGGPMNVQMNQPRARERVQRIPPVARRSVQGTTGPVNPNRIQNQIGMLQGVLREIAPHLIALGHAHGQMQQHQLDPQGIFAGLAQNAQGQIGQSLLNREHPPRAQAQPQQQQSRKLRHMMEYTY